MTFEELGGGRGDSPLADEVDVIQVNEDREMSFATRSLLVERANRLAEALERLRDGEYGVCQECEEAIAPARLKAMPEVMTCVRCQDRLERMTRHLAPVGAGLTATSRGRRKPPTTYRSTRARTQPGPVGDDAVNAPPNEPVRKGRLVDCPDMAAEPRRPHPLDVRRRSTSTAGQMASAMPGGGSAAASGSRAPERAERDLAD